MTQNHYDVIIIGGGVSGAALFYELGRYTTTKSICLLEKYGSLASLNSNGSANSQTIHCGDIETNYTLEKAAKVKRTAKMVEKYCLSHGYEDKVIFSHQKLALGVGHEEVNYMRHRYEEFKTLYPYLKLYTKEQLAEIEPAVIFDKDGKERPEDIVGIGAQGEYTTVDFKALSDTFIDNTLKIKDKITDIFFNNEVKQIQKIGSTYHVQTTMSQFTADFVVVDAGAHSLFLAHKMGYGLDYGCLPMAGSFYMGNRKILNGKVYMVQNPKLPFAALHGDPDILVSGFTRFGPTALMLPKLERFKPGTYMDFFKTLRLDWTVLKIFYDLFKDADIRNYVLKNFMFEVPYINKKLFLQDARKIVPSLSEEDISYAKGFGGVRPQILDKKNQKLMLGEASINTGEGIIFNMTPSPGATSCLGNAVRDVEAICKYLGLEFDEKLFNAELVDEEPTKGENL
ncbi:MAG: FAD-dependent oxidoreductase [Epsilonproteobacteria bacterium]|nr:FAD-dependent oxidoreductase [Campylobacterota bacterium]OIO17180.1 MAG: malate:quinone oxidoreductase [Helicobacteraceae bacterium CG1_02_36_14]PIP10308.1 MAG: malate:quinone oxidoreductase [Sulfurimonas sp. CG23_combo_of_CG06-09_8_20_14_all_36_33]PIS26373.1 MAG: malate:quinone oxidoreductase [Sulfurimonas sp. CG08_land_8_20_14_0_20_36_33]PIU33835.1 MAG: malate:quinone oxidoreductase [Sulfurimonas sp. CG07_land_8_20_14_0_80_36_56]PIV03663.1 MAG: malate:quinone oxidoreductase [Sulfurimonas 